MAAVVFGFFMGRHYRIQTSVEFVSTESKPCRYSAHGDQTPTTYGDSQMGSLSNESFEQFLDSLKKAGITISNEAELRERLAEAQRWRFAFQTLAANGKLLGISFEDHSEGRNEAEINRAFNDFQFSENSKAVFSANLKH
jgi:hypothetical protein